MGEADAGKVGEEEKSYGRDAGDDSVVETGEFEAHIYSTVDDAGFTNCMDRLATEEDGRNIRDSHKAIPFVYNHPTLTLCAPLTAIYP